MTLLTPKEKQLRREARDRATRGAELLDKAMPTWFKKIDLKSLDLADCSNCMCGQLAQHSRAAIVVEELDEGYSGYAAFKGYLARKFGFYEWGGFSYDHGFLGNSGAEYKRLDTAWERLIRNRLREAQ